MSIEILFNGKANTGKKAPSVDIVAVHGLNPTNKANHARRTWENQESKHLWLRDAIPLDRKTVRTMLYAYESSPVFGADKERFIHQANALLECLRLTRREHPKVPLILMGHSLGGILIKQALVNANSNPKYRDVKDSTFGLVFFGTPHAGPTEDAKVKFGRACAAIAQSLSSKSSNDIMEALKRGSTFSDLLQENWRHQLESYHIVSFYEGIGNLVPHESAVFSLAGDRENQVRLNADHRSMCRFNPAVEVEMENYFLVRGNILDLIDSATDKTTKAHQKAFDELLESLESYGRNPRHDKIDMAYENSFEWLWDTGGNGTGFAEWLQNDEALFWISGKPGSGKSTMMRYALHDWRLKNYLSIRKGQPYRVAYFFFHELGIGSEQNMLGFLHGILAQLLREFEELTPFVMPTFERLKGLRETGLFREERSIWTEHELTETLQFIFQQDHSLERICLFIDGLDECAGDHREQLNFLLRWIMNANQTQKSFKVCIASRPLLEIEHRLARFPGFKIHEWTVSDIGAYATSRFRQAIEMISFSSSTQIIRKDVELELVNNILDKACGVFLWVKLVVEEIIIGLEDGDTDAELQERLDYLPSELEDLYQRIFSQISSKYLDDAFNYFQLLVHAIDSSLELVLFALACEEPLDALSPDEDENEKVSLILKEDCKRIQLRIKSRCRGLLQLTASGEIASSPFLLKHCSVEFLHKTVKEYVTTACLNTSMRSTVHENQIKNPPVSLMAACLRLIKTNFHDISSDFYKSSELSNRPAIVEFFEYARAAEESTESSQAIYVDEMDYYLSDFYYHTALRISGTRADSRTWNTDILCIAIHHGLSIYVFERLCADNIDISKKRSGRPLLQYAFDNPLLDSPRWLDMISDLLRRGADVNETFQGQTAWLQAVCMVDRSTWQRDADGWISACELMLEHGADVHSKISQSSDPLRNPETALISFLQVIGNVKPSSSQRKRLANLVKIFLRLGADLNVTNEEGITALDIAIRSYSEIRTVVCEHLQEQKSRKRGRSTTPTGQGTLTGKRAVLRQKRR